MQYEDLIVEVHGKVALIRLNRPKALNALNDRMMNELGEVLLKFDADPAIGHAPLPLRRSVGVEGSPTQVSTAGVLRCVSTPKSAHIPASDYAFIVNDAHGGSAYG